MSKKIGNKGLPVSYVTELEDEESKNEIARMISGKIITKEAIAAAEKLIN